MDKGTSKARLRGRQAYYAGYVVEDAVKFYPIGTVNFDEWVGGFEEARKFLPSPAEQEVQVQIDRDVCLDFPLGDGSVFGVCLTKQRFWKMVLEVAEKEGHVESSPDKSFHVITITT